MGYSNNWSYSGQRSGNRYGNAPYSNGYNNNNYQPRNNNRSKKKHSGAKYLASTKNGNPAISAWNYSRRLGLVNVLIAPYHGSKVVQSENGRSWAVWMAKIQGKGVSEHFPVLVDMASKKAIVKKYGWVVNPSAPNGGYCGSFSRK